MGIAGALCAAGLFAALSSPTEDVTVPMASLTPTNATEEARSESKRAHDATGAHAGSVESIMTETDPRAFVMELALSGKLGASSPAWSDASAEVVSRNGDIVLVALSVLTQTGQRETVNVLLVHAKNTWVMRDVYTEPQNSAAT